MARRVSGFLSLFLLVSAVIFSSCSTNRERKVLVFFQPQGEQVPAGLHVIRQMGEQDGFAVDTSSQADHFSEENLQNYSAVIFLGVPGDSLPVWQQTDIERFVQSGGGLVGIDSKMTARYTWPWYDRLIAETSNEVQNPEYQEMPVQLMAAREGEIPEGMNVWSGDYDGGQAVYISGERVSSALGDTQVKAYVQQGIAYAMGDNVLDYDKARSLRTPEESRFVKQTLVPGPLHEPTEMAILPDGKVIFTERKGAVKMYYPQNESMRQIAQIDVHTKFENGLMGIAKDPDFYDNNWVYMYYSPNTEDTVQNLSRFLLLGDSLIMSSEKLILQVPVQRRECCHTGGSIAFGPDGLLYLSTGDDINPFESNGYAPIDERPGRFPFDAQSSSGNSNDLRGKVIRIRVNDDASYSIPDGNLFPKDDPLSRPEIYVMGTRNSYRISVDQKTGWLYWGDVGPDARADGEAGTKGYDEVKQAKEAGFYGWPYFRGNRPYRDHNFATGEIGDFFDFTGPVNNSPNNTGRSKLPPFKKSLVWYPYDESPEFPIVGTGGRNAMAGPVYHYDMYQHAESRFPEYYDEKLFIYDWMRNWIIAVTLDENGNLMRLEPFLDSFDFTKIIDMEMGHDGNLYILEYGSDWFAENADASLSRINFAEGNRAPVARIKADQTVGAAPFTVQFSAEESFDYDEGDALNYTWNFTGEEKQAEEMNPGFTFEEAGIYQVSVTVSDQEGDTDVQKLTVSVGNERPKVEIALPSNETFYFEDEPIRYTVKVTDREDGSLGNGIAAEEVGFSFSYSAEEAATNDLGHKSSVNGLSLIDNSGCKACHAFEKASVGPAYQEVAQRYEDTEENKQMLVNKILNGGKGNWGDRAMPAQAVSEEEATVIVDYLMTLDAQTAQLPLSGIIDPATHVGAPGGKLVFKANYTDRGDQVVGPLASSTTLALRAPKVEAESYDFREGSRPRDTKGFSYMGDLRDEAYFGFDDIDLKGISSLQVKIGANAPGFTLNVVSGKPDGKVLATQAIPSTSKVAQFKEVEIPLGTVPDGRNDLYFVVSTEGDTGRAQAFVDWIYFNKRKDKKLAAR